MGFAPLWNLSSQHKLGLMSQGCIVTDVSSWVHPTSRTPNNIDLDQQINRFPEHRKKADGRVMVANVAVPMLSSDL